MIGFDDISSTSAVKAKVELFNGSALAATCACSDYLQDFVVNRQGDMSKFFGFGICQKLSLNLIDIEKKLPEITTDNTAKIYFGDGINFDCPYPIFYITEVNRNERDNTITATAYDCLNLASKHTFAELGINAPYTLRNVAEAIASLLELTVNVENDTNGSFSYTFDAANLSEEGTENLREILDYIAECTQTVYFINYENVLTFKRLDRDGDAVFTITKDLYFELDTKTNRRLSAICNTTELSDNVEATTGETGTTQYVRNNPFWELRTDIGAILDNAIAAIGGFTINQFRCDWDGDYRLEIGDKIGLIKENDETAISYVLSDTITYDGTITEITEWEYTENDNETASNPSTLGEKLNQTYARVDKVNKEIELLVTETSDNTSKISQIELDLDGINLTLQEHKEAIDNIEIPEPPDLTDLQNTVKTHTEKISQIELDINSITAEVSETKQSISTTETTLKEYTDNAVSGAKNELEGDISDSLAESKEYADGVGTNANSYADSVAEAAKNYSDEKLQAYETTTNAKISALEISNENISATVSEQSTKIATLESDTSDLKGSVSNNTEKISALELENDSITASVSEQSSKITTLEGQASENATKISGLETETGNLKTTVSANSTKIGQLEVTTNSINASVSSQASKITTLETTTSNQGTEIDNLSDAVEENTSDISTLTQTTETHTSQIASIQINADSINTTVTNLETSTSESMDAINSEMNELKQEVATKVTAEDVTISIKSELENGVDKVTTQTGFTFNEEGLTVEKSGKEMKTQITEDGMTVYKDSTAVLTANNTGVDAKNLKASTYLIIGTNSRFENYGTNRTACFWIGD